LNIINLLYNNKFPIALVKPLMCRLHLNGPSELFGQTCKPVQHFNLPVCKPILQKHMKDVPSTVLSNPNLIAWHRPEFQVNTHAKLYKQTAPALDHYSYKICACDISCCGRGCCAYSIWFMHCISCKMAFSSSIL